MHQSVSQTEMTLLQAELLITLTKLHVAIEEQRRLKEPEWQTWHPTTRKSGTGRTAMMHR